VGRKRENWKIRGGERERRKGRGKMRGRKNGGRKGIPFFTEACPRPLV